MWKDIKGYEGIYRRGQLNRPLRFFTGSQTTGAPIVFVFERAPAGRGFKCETMGAP